MRCRERCIATSIFIESGQCSGVEITQPAGRGGEEYEVKTTKIVNIIAAICTDKNYFPASSPSELVHW